jgi:hypothetical protein
MIAILWTSGGESTKRARVGNSAPIAGNSVPTVVAPSGDTLTQEEMLSLMQSRGIWDPFDGWHRHNNFEILRVGPYNEQGKFYPVQVKVTDVMNNGSTRESVYDCRILKNDYGDWETRKMGF